MFRSDDTSRIAGIMPILSQQFELIHPSPTSDFPLISDDPRTFLSYASGRKSVVSTHTTFSLLPRHDPFLLLWAFLRPIFDVSAPAAQDELTFDVQLRPVEDGYDIKFAKNNAQVVFVPQEGTDAEGSSNGVGLASGSFAVVKKRHLNNLRKERWDLVSI